MKMNYIIIKVVSRKMEGLDNNNDTRREESVTWIQYLKINNGEQKTLFA